MKIRTFKLFSLGVIFTVALVMGSIAIAQIYETQDYTVEHMADIADHPSGYFLRDSEGYIGVYYKDRGHPVFITNIPLASLRGQDREDVEQGIAVATRKELIQLLEDLGS